MFNFFHKKDHRIREDVRTEIGWDPRIASENINVSIQDGGITLAAWNAPGVKEVVNNLNVTV